VGEFNYTRLDLARRRRGLTKTALAEEAGISTRILTAYEREEKMPSAETVGRIARTLGFPVEFFSGPDLDEPSLEGSSFRALSNLSARQRDRALGSAALALELSKWIAARFDLPEADVPQFPNVDAETAAEALRGAWGLGERAAPNMVHLLEAHGVRVFSLAEETAEVDAFSFWLGDVPFVFLNTMKSAERSRMDAAHELGHLCLHRHGGPRGREAEQEAQGFGAAFLMPRGSVLAEAPRSARVEHLIRAKRRWKVAVANLAYRMHSLNLLTDWQYRSIFIEISRKGYRTNEPREIPRETSQVLAKVLRSLRAERLSQSQIARELSIPVEELSKMAFGLVLTPLNGEGMSMQGRPPEGGRNLEVV
jgi:Zn-dependent peptidase ImmA (M78 family)/DNA-binding XRE family transcriptional regulator